ALGRRRRPLPATQERDDGEHQQGGQHQRFFTTLRALARFTGRALLALATATFLLSSVLRSAFLRRPVAGRVRARFGSARRLGFSRAPAGPVPRAERACLSVAVGGRGEGRALAVLRVDFLPPA